MKLPLPIPDACATRAPFLQALLARARCATSALVACALLTPAGASAQGPILPDPKPFPKVDVVGGPWVNLATFPVRPMVFTPSGTLWVVNHHDSTIERFFGTNPAPDRVYPVPWSPVAIGYWPGNGGAFGPELLVVCRGTWAVVGVNPSTGAPTRVLQLRPGSTLPLGVDSRIGRMAEPGDILVDDVNHRAFVSCTGADCVIQIDLVANQIVRVFNEEADNGSQAGTSKFRIKSPLFLSWSKNREFVLCAPLHSGNNTMAEPNLASSKKVVSYAGGTPGLPDEDLFRINPYVNAGNPGSVQVVLHATGTILFAHGINPNTDDFWQLNTEALNTKGQTEPELKGGFLENRVSIVQNNDTTWGSVVDAKVLDPQPAPSPYTETNTVGQPFALDFRDDGYGFITGLLTDNVLVLDQNGNYDMEWDLPAGSIPRGILVSETTPTQAFVYCWGDNKVRSYTVDTTANTATLTLTYNLRYDPTPPLVADGRRMFFDADRSLHKNVSCASCHIEAGNDFLVWNLSNGPLEEKGPMFTQTLVGLQRLAPFHWRGERSLADFNEFAFKGLLGASSVPSPADFAGFEAYIFSLSNPANPNQNRKRLVDASIHHPDTLFEDGVPGQNLSVLHQQHSSLVTGNAVAGIDEFQSPSLVNVGRHSCVDCHDFPTGTNNDINVEQEGSPAPRRAAQKPAPFHEGWRKRQSLVRVNHPSLPSRDVPFLGSGFSHIGEAQDLFSFVSLVIDETTGPQDPLPPLPTLEDLNFGLDDQKANDITDLVHQWDQGLGLAAHFAYLLDANNANSATTTAELGTYLGFQRVDGNCDIAVIGMSKNSSGVLVRRRWAWMNLVSAFVCEDAAFANRSLAAFQTGATNGETNVFLGLPPGMAERWAIDYDMDGVRNLDATESGFQYDPTQPGWNNGVAPRFATGTTPVIVWESTRVARLVFTTNEPTSATIVYDEGKTASHTTYSPIGGNGTGAQRRMARFHSVLLTDLRPSTSSIDAASFAPGEQGYAPENVVYTVTITLQDATGNVAVTTPFTFDTDDFIVPAELEGAPGTEEPPEFKNQRTHTIQKICLGGPNCDEVTPAGIDAWNIDVELDLAFKRGEWQAPAPGFQDGEPQPASSRAVVGRVMILRGGVVLSAPGAGVTVGTTTNNTVLVDTVVVNDEFELQTVAENPQTQAPDRFLAGTAVSGSDGKVHVLFSVANVLPSDRIVFNVEAVVEVRVPAPLSGIIPIDTSIPGQIEYYSWRGINQWSFPNTKEKNSSVISMPIP